MRMSRPDTLTAGYRATKLRAMSGSPDLRPPKAPATLPLDHIDRRVSLGERAYISLKEAIVGGQFSAGQKLTVRSVAHALSISTTPARDAIMRLLSEGALISAGQKTVMVPTLTLAALDEVTFLRLTLEGFAAQAATDRIAGETVEELKALQLQLDAAMVAANCAGAMTANKAFHLLIYQSAQMPLLVSMVESLWTRIDASIRGFYPELATSRSGLSNHMEAIAGLEDHDKTRVQAAIEKDIKDEYQYLVSGITKRRR